MAARTRVELTRIAFHEAGHIVAFYLGRRRFRYATIIPDGDALGHVRYTEHREPDIGISTHLDRARLVGLFAGMVAQMIGPGPRTLAWASRGAWHDMEEAAPIIQYWAVRECYFRNGLPGQEAFDELVTLLASHPYDDRTRAMYYALCDARNRVHDRALRETKAVLETHWSAVEAVAAALLERRRIGCVTARRIVQAALAASGIAGPSSPDPARFGEHRNCHRGPLRERRLYPEYVQPRLVPGCRRDSVERRYVDLDGKNLVMSNITKYRT